MEEIVLRLKLSAEQWYFVKQLGIEDKEYTKEEIDDFVIETIADHLMAKGWRLDTQEYVTNEIGNMCESIIDVLTEM